MTEIVRGRGSQKYGGSTWYCSCGARHFIDGFHLPKGWLHLRITKGTGNVLEDRDEQVLCNKCALDFNGTRPSPLKRLNGQSNIIRRLKG